MPASLGFMFGNLSSPVYLIGTLSPRDVDIVLLFRSGSLILRVETPSMPCTNAVHKAKMERLSPIPNLATEHITRYLSANEGCCW